MNKVSIETLVSLTKFFTSDSRLAEEGALFVALKGEHHDGHHFMRSLTEKKSLSGFLISSEYFKEQQDFLEKQNIPFAVADDTQAAHREVAKLFRSKYPIKVVAVGGSSGKTSCKEFLATLLSQKYSLFFTQKSQNGEQGIPKTWEQLRASHQLAVIEVGIDRPGDMQRHMEVVQPDAGVLTSIGEEHLLYLKDLETVFKEESLLFEAVWARGGKTYAPLNDALLSRFQGHPSTRLTPDAPSDLLSGLTTQLTHPYALRNLSLAVAICLDLGLSREEIEKGMAQIKIPEGRGQIFEPRPNQVLIADHYNSNPSSLRSALVFAELEARRRQLDLYLILGDMLELGNDSAKLHSEFVERIQKLSPKKVFLIGPQMSALAPHIHQASSFEDSTKAAASIKSLSNTPGLFYFKGSRGMRLENTLKEFNTQN